MNEHLTTFIDWLGDREPGLGDVYGYRRYLQEAFANVGTKRCKWADMKSFLLRNTNLDPEALHREFGGALYLFPFAGVGSNPAYKISDSQYYALLDAATDRDGCLMMAIWETGLRISEVLSLRPSDLRVSDRLRRHCESVMGRGEYLLMTSNGRRYHRAYVTNRIRKCGRRVLGKQICAESLRRGGLGE